MAKALRMLVGVAAHYDYFGRESTPSAHECTRCAPDYTLGAADLHHVVAICDTATHREPTVNNGGSSFLYGDTYNLTHCITRDGDQTWCSGQGALGFRVVYG